MNAALAAKDETKHDDDHHGQLIEARGVTVARQTGVLKNGTFRNATAAITTMKAIRKFAIQSTPRRISNALQV